MARKKKVWEFEKFVGLVVVAVVVMVVMVGVATRGSEASGFDEFGYNYKARLFQGKVDGADRTLDGKYWGDPTYAKDLLVMKWSKAWDVARFGGGAWTCEAWIDNEWNGKKEGSGEIWHYKIAWVGPELQGSDCWREGGYPIWGEFEVIFSQGSVANEHFWDAHAERAGYGVFK